MKTSCMKFKNYRRFYAMLSIGMELKTNLKVDLHSIGAWSAFCAFFSTFLLVYEKVRAFWFAFL